MISLRTRIFGPGADEPLLRTKAPKGAKNDMLDSVTVPRAETRRADGRGRDRHRLTAEQAVLRHNEHEHVIELVNLSAGGAMIRGELDLMLWDHLWCSAIMARSTARCVGSRTIQPASSSPMKRGSTAILMHTTTCSARSSARAFPTSSFARTSRKLSGCSTQQKSYNAGRTATRSCGTVSSYDDSHDYDAEPVRLRNISETGALVQSGNPLPKGVRVYLDMKAAGRPAATVK